MPTKFSYTIPRGSPSPEIRLIHPQNSSSTLFDKHENVRSETIETYVDGDGAVPGWPTEPTILSKGRSRICHDVFVESLLVLSTLPFFALAIVILRYSGKAVVDSEWNTLRQIINSLSTAFPYVFGIVVGRSMKLLGAWWLEHGVSLGLLEQIMGSTTAGGTLLTHGLLKPFNFPALGLFALWIFSPLGSRVLLGLVEPQLQPIRTNTTVRYLDTLQSTKYYSQEVIIPIEVLAGPINSLYLSTLLPPPAAKAASMDPWANVKIPYFDRLRSNITANGTGWKIVPETGVQYSSLIGLPTVDAAEFGNSTFTTTSTYMDLDCYNITRGQPIPLNVKVDGVTWHGLSNQNNGSFFVAIDGFNMANDTLYNPAIGYSVRDFTNATNSSSIPHTLLFQSSIWDSTTNNAGRDMSIAYCRLSQKYVESQINCSYSLNKGQACRVTAMRPSTQPQAPSNFTALGFRFLFEMFSYGLPQASGENVQGIIAESSATENYISDPTSPSGNLAAFTFANLSKLSKEDMDVRLGQVINTYYMASISPFAMAGNLTNGNSTILTAAGQNTILEQRYAVNSLWIALYIIACWVLLVSAIAGVILNILVIAPDVLGYISSMTRDNPYVSLPEGGTALPGPKRTLLLREMKVRLGNVGKDSERVGHIALASMDKSRRLVKGASYY